MAKKRQKVYTRPEPRRLPKGKLKPKGEYPPKYKVYERPRQRRKGVK